MSSTLARHTGPGLCQCLLLHKMTFTSVRILQNGGDIYLRHCRRQCIRTSASQMKIVKFLLSDIGEGIKEVTVRDWFVKVGDRVKQFDDVCLVESDKAAVNITSRYDGIVTKIYHQDGAIAQVGKPLIDIDTEDSASESIDDNAESIETQSSSPLKAEAQSLAVKHSDSAPAQDLPARADNSSATNSRRVTGDNEQTDKPLMTPAVRRLVKEHRIPLADIKGTGKGGRVMKEDLLNYIDVTSKTTPFNEGNQPTTNAARKDSGSPIARPDRVVPVTGIKKAMARAMAESHTIPSFGFSDELDVTKLVSLRNEIKADGSLSVTYMPFFIKALSLALEDFPELNAHTDGKCENLTVKGEHNVGFAVDTASGLLVPNIKNVQRLSILEISDELSRLIGKAKDRTLSVHDLTGGTITISNIGIIGGTYVRPMINPPEVTIVGLGRFRKRPVYDDNDEIVPAFTCNASWSADHRVIDGATLARFAEKWKHLIENPLKLLLNSR
ncbi:Hypothetical protein NTJ_01558 [Nesidiocoris tenuis]|uniref:Dihydrolipoamide acetyltransferase component of pyruvate dehydrogenase complex n=1 Tax=Nesidiocoris tenuis TaxID=355587 RepID=A0ABN7A8X3_9HEMI|nr:Hypothetical protein NTJ_01558 [Nesidiocoris tenuis]